MTKIKNTKKGMAKKTLSMSLVVAMLATSNVPVWAAEFSDGSDDVAVATEAPAVEDTTDTFSAEEETPAVTDEATTDAATAVVEKGDLILDNVTVSKSQTFGSGKKVAVTGTIKYKDGNDVRELTDYDFGWRVKGTTNAIFTDHVASDNTTDKMSFYPDFVGGATYTPKTEWIESGAKNIDWSEYAGKTLELYVYNNEADDNIKINPTVIGETTIEKCAIDGKLVLNKDNASNKITYNGKDFYYTSNDTDTSPNAVKLVTSGTALTDVTGDTVPGKASGSGAATWDAATVLKYFDVAATKTAKNADEKLTVTATAKADSPYTGTVSADALIVQKKPINVVKDLVATVDAGITYPYAGKNINIDLSKVHLKESDDLSGADLSSAIESAKTVNYDLGTQQVVLTIKKDALKNFSFTKPDEKTFTLNTSDASDANKVTITQRDLENDCTISIKHDGKVLDGTSVTDFVKDYLEIKDKDGTSLKAATNNGTETVGTGLLKDKDYVVTVYDEDGKVVTGAFSGIGTSYKISVTANKNTANPTAQTCVRGQELTVSVTDNIVGNVSYTNQAYKPAYTGEEIKPSKSDLGALEITGLDGRKVTFQSDQWEFTGKYTNNVNATVYNKNGSIKTQAYAEVKILGTSSYAGQTVQVPFEILPLTVTASSVTVPKTVTYNKGYGEASDYNVQLIVTAKDATGKIVKGLNTDDYSVKFEYVDGTNANTATGTQENDIAQNELHDLIKATITVKNSNFAGAQGKVTEVVMPAAQYTEIVEKAITSDMIKINPSSYTYTGGNIVPTYSVIDGAIALYDKAEYGNKGEYEEVSITNNKDVGTGTVTVKGVEGKYSGTASANFTITAANTSDVKVTFTDDSECQYTGKQVRPRTFKATLNGNDVSNQFEIVSYGENISGKGTVVLKTVDGNKNFTGANITAEFNIIKEYVKADLNVFNSNGANVTSAYKVTNETATNYNGKSFDFDGTAKTFASEVLKNISKTNATGSDTATSKAKEADFEIKYIDNISGKNTGMKDSSNNRYNIAYVYVVAKDGTGYTGTKSFTTSDGTTIKGVVDYVAFAIKNVEFVEKNVYVQNATYAGGLPVKPNVLVQINGNTLVEGKDYTITLDANRYSDASGVNFVNVTDGKVYKVKVTGINGYAGSKVSNLTWGIDKKDINDCDVKVTNGVVTVMNGYIPVPTTEYTSKNNGDGTYTVTANSASKNYTGSKTVTAEGKAADEKPDAPMINSVKVVGNKATVILSGEADGASGYDYVISTDRDCITNKDYTSVNKNQVKTNTTFEYVGQNTYYAYCHAWKRDENGKKVFSDWSNAYPFVVSAITPSQPVITSVKVSGSTVTVTYTKSSNADGYDVVLGTSTKKVNGETRPVEYGKLVKKNIKGNVVTATFKNVKKGSYYAGLHAFNRTSEDGKKVFSQWSNVKKVTVK